MLKMKHNKMNNDKAQTEIEVILYKDEYDNSYTDIGGNNVKISIRTEVWLNGVNWGDTILQETENGKVMLYDKNYYNNWRHVINLSKDDRLTTGCVASYDIDDDKLCYECGECEYEEECLDIYGWKNKGRDPKGTVKSANWVWGMIYFNGHETFFISFKNSEPLKLKLRELEEIKELYKNDIRAKDYTFWKDIDTNDIWLRRWPCRYDPIDFTEWEKFSSKNIEDLKGWIETYEYS
jgi:hypothetical protein